MDLKLLAPYKFALRTIVKAYKTSGFPALFGYYLLTLFLFGAPVIGSGILLTWLLGTSKGWPAAIAAFFMVFVSFPLAPLIFVIMRMMRECVSVTRWFSRAIGTNDFPIRDKIEKWANSHTRDQG